MFRKAIERTDVLKALVHVPKVAGSTLNAHLARWRPGISHVHHYAERPDRLRRKLRRASWVSGHMALNEMNALLAATCDRPVEYFGVVRDPVEHVASHYNWFIEIRHRGYLFYRRHRRDIRDLSDVFHASDNRDPDIVAKNILLNPIYFLNVQARYLFGNDLDLESFSAFSPLFARYSGLTTEIDMLALQMTGTGLKVEETKNVSAHHFDRTVFRSQEMLDFLQEYNRHDIRLFAELKASVQ